MQALGDRDVYSAPTCLVSGSASPAPASSVPPTPPPCARSPAPGAIASSSPRSRTRSASAASASSRRSAGGARPRIPPTCSATLAPPSCARRPASPPASRVHAAAAAGVHLFCEKPIGMSHDEAAAMAAAVRHAGVHAQVGLVLRFSPVYTVMRALLRDAGHPLAVWFRDDQCFPIRGLHDTGWRKDRALSAGGTLIEHGVHDVDLLTWMFGPLARVRAVEHNRAGHPGIEDYVAADLVFTTGVRAQLLNVWHDMAGRPSNRRLEVFCHRAFVASEHDMFGEVEWQHDDHPMARLDADEVVRRYMGTLARRDDTFARWHGLPYFMQVLAFVEALLEDRPPAPGLDDGVEAQRVVEAIYRAARSGDEVAVSDRGGRAG